MQDIDQYENQRDRMIKDRVRELMAGNPNRLDDFSLSLPDNLDEFLQESLTQPCGEEARGNMLAILHNLPAGDKTKSFEQLGRTFYCAFHEYMAKLALSRAEREVPSARELRDSEAQEAAEARAEARREQIRETYRAA